MKPHSTKPRARATPRRDSTTSDKRQLADSPTADIAASIAGLILDPAHSRRDATDAELFAEVEHPLGLVDMWADRGVTANAAFHRARVHGSIEVRIATNIKGGSGLSLRIETDGELKDPELDLLAHDVDARALVTLAVLLPRVVEMARRAGLLDNVASTEEVPANA